VRAQTLPAVDDGAAPGTGLVGVVVGQAVAASGGAALQMQAAAGCSSGPGSHSVVGRIAVAAMVADVCCHQP
jgi:hypothetical protein